MPCNYCVHSSFHNLFFYFFKSISAGTFLYFCRQSVCISLAVMYQVPGGRRNVIGVIYRRAQISNCLTLSRSTKYKHYYYRPGQQGRIWHMAQAQMSSIAKHKYETTSYHVPGQSDHPGIGIQVRHGICHKWHKVSRIFKNLTLTRV